MKTSASTAKNPFGRGWQRQRQVQRCPRITYVQVLGKTVILLAVYGKSEQSSISDQQVLRLFGKWMKRAC